VNGATPRAPIMGTALRLAIESHNLTRQHDHRYRSEHIEAGSMAEVPPGGGKILSVSKIDGTLEVSEMIQVNDTAAKSTDEQSTSCTPTTTSARQAQKVTTSRKVINLARIGDCIEQLQENFGTDEVASLVAVLEAMKRNPRDHALMDRLSKAFNGLGIMQGAVLTYAPYLAVILSDDPFNNPA